MKKKNLILAGAFLFAANVLGQTPYIPHAMNLSKGGTDFSFGFDYFVTQQVVNDEGEAANINDADDSAAYSKMDFDFIGKYGITDKLEINAGVRARYIQTAFQADYGSGVEEYSLTTSGLESYFVGAKFGLKIFVIIKF